MKTFEEYLAEANSQKVFYSYLVYDNSAGADRRPTEPSEIDDETHEEKFSLPLNQGEEISQLDFKALCKVIKGVFGEEGFKKTEDAVEFIESQDLGAGHPIVFWVRRGLGNAPTVLADLGLTPKDLAEESE